MSTVFISNLTRAIGRRLSEAFSKVGRKLKREFEEANALNQELLERKREKEKQLTQVQQFERNIKMLGKVAKAQGGKTVPAYVLVGFLGSGKTTLLGKLIGWCDENGLKPGLIINEFGAAWIDSATVRQAGMPLSELAGGCICCTADEELIPALVEMAANPEVDLILLEASGLADPADMLDELTDPALWERVEVGGVISVVDASRYEELVEVTKLARRQVEYADVLVMNKCDLIREEDRAALEKRLAQTAPRAKIFGAERGLPYAGVEAVLAHSLELGRKRYQRQAELQVRAKDAKKFSLKVSNSAPTEETHQHDHQAEHEHDRAHIAGPHGYAQLSIHTLQIDLEQPLDKASFELFLKSLPRSVYRAKGFVKIKDDSRPHIFQHMPGYTKVLPFRKEEFPALRGVFIGEELDESWLNRRLIECQEASF